MRRAIGVFAGSCAAAALVAALLFGRATPAGDPLPAAPLHELDRIAARLEDEAARQEDRAARLVTSDVYVIRGLGVHPVPRARGRRP